MKNFFLLILLFWLSIFSLAAQDLRPIDKKSGTRGLLLVTNQKLCYAGIGATGYNLKIHGQEVEQKDHPLSNPRISYGQTQELSFGCRLYGFLFEYSIFDDAWELEKPLELEGERYSHIQTHLERAGLGWGWELVQHYLYVDFYLGRYALSESLVRSGLVRQEELYQGSYGAIGLTYHLSSFLALDLSGGQGLQEEGLGQFARLGAKFHMRF